MPSERKNGSQRYIVSPMRVARGSRSPVNLHLNNLDSYRRRRSRSRSVEKFDPRGRSPRRQKSPVRSPIRAPTRSPIRSSPIRSAPRIRYSRSPPKNRRRHGMSPIHRPKNRSSSPGSSPRRNSHVHSKRSRSRSGSNMDIASTGSSDNMFRSNTFRPIEKKKAKKIKISALKDLARDEESSSPEGGYRGYKIRNAPKVRSKRSKRKSRWDADQNSLPVPNTKDILKQQGISNPDKALKNIADLPTMESRFKSKTDDNSAIQEQLRILEQQKLLRENLPPTIGLPTPTAFSAIGKPPHKVPTVIATSSATALIPPNSKSVTNSISGSLPRVNNIPPIPAFPPPGFPGFQASLPGASIIPGMPPNFAGAPPPGLPLPAAVPVSFGIPPPPFNIPSTGLMPSVSSAMHLPMMSQISGTSQVFGGQQPVFQQAELQLDPSEIVFRARADLYRRDLSEFRSISELVKYMWNQGSDSIPASDPPLLFNEVLKTREGILGASALYQIICFGHPELETYYCGMCNHWTTVSEMFGHLVAPTHRINYLARKYKLFHKKTTEYTNLAERDKFLDVICKKIWNSIEGSGQCANRMRCILNIDAIKQVWPNYFEYVDNSWKMLGESDELSAMLGKPKESQLDEQPVSLVVQTDIQYPGSSANKGKIMIKPSVSTVLSREPVGELEKVNDRSSRERRHSRSRERSSKKVSRRPSRSSSQTRHGRHHSRPPKNSKCSKDDRKEDRDRKEDWDRKAAEFINRIGNDGISSTLNSLGTSQAKNSTESARAHLRRKETIEDQEKTRLIRKALAVLVQLQELHDDKGSIKESMIYAVAAEMGMSESEVQQSIILKQGLENMNIISDSAMDQQKTVSLESLGMSSSDLKRLLSSVTAPKNDASVVYPEIDSQSQIAIRIRALIMETKQKLNDPKNVHMFSELQRQLDHLETKLSQELGDVQFKRPQPESAAMNYPRPLHGHLPNVQPLPGAWRGTLNKTRREPEGSTPATKNDQRFDPARVEREWTEYFLKDPSQIEQVNSAIDQHAEAQYDEHYGPGTYKAFVAIKRRAAEAAKKTLSAARVQSKPYFEDFNA